MHRRTQWLVVGLALLAGACSRSGRDTAPQRAGAAVEPSVASSVAAAIAPAAVASTSGAAAVPAAAPAAAAAAPPRAPSLPGSSILRGAVAVEPARRLALAPGAETVVHPAATFEVELSARAADARLVLVDARDDLVPATATRELGAGTRLTLAPAAPLVPASRYALRIDGASDRELHDDAGRAFSPVTLPILAAGSPPPPAAKKQKPVRRKRRHR